ncbi:MAG: hypothetical protein HUU46_03350 [Candidatus Hydrogenedentes bacterium]|nr:hypothetical protein [Candidatus Hydrogenedentota bacterium]
MDGSRVGAPSGNSTTYHYNGAVFSNSRPIPTFDNDGKPVRTYSGKNCAQILVLPFPDADGDGICD